MRGRTLLCSSYLQLLANRRCACLWSCAGHRQGSHSLRHRQPSHVDDASMSAMDELKALEARVKALETIAESRLSQHDTMRLRISQLEQSERVWRKERAQLLREVDRNTSSSILRREELHFTRTQLLRETLRLKGELEHKPMPPAPIPASAVAGCAQHLESTPRTPSPQPPAVGAGGSRAQSRPSRASPRHTRQQVAAVLGSPGTRGRPQSSVAEYRDAPPTPGKPTTVPRTFVHGLAPRAPRSLDGLEVFEEYAPSSAPPHEPSPRTSERERRARGRGLTALDSCSMLVRVQADHARAPRRITPTRSPGTAGFSAIPRTQWRACGEHGGAPQ